MRGDRGKFSTPPAPKRPAGPTHQTFWTDTERMFLQKIRKWVKKVSEPAEASIVDCQARKAGAPAEILAQYQIIMKGRKMRSILFAMSALVVGALAVPKPAQANIVLNGGFETGTFANWTTHTCTVGCAVQGYRVVAANPHTGRYAAVTLCVNGAACLNPVTGDYFRQALPTVAGSTYTLTFWLRPDNSTPNGQTVYWNGGLVGSFLNEPGGVYTQLTIPSLMATSGSTMLQFNGFHDPAAIYIDDIVVELSGAAVPEPASVLLLGVGLLGLGITKRRTRS